MRKFHLLLLSFVLASRAFGACGGEVGSDHGSGGSAGSGGNAGFPGDGSTDDIDATPDAADTPDVDASDADVQTCVACSAKVYDCAAPGKESFSWTVSAAGPGGCVVTNPVQKVPGELHCDPLELCNSPPTTCFPVMMEPDGKLTYTPGQQPKVSCYPKN